MLFDFVKSWLVGTRFEPTELRIQICVLRDVLLRKMAVLLDVVQMRGGEGPAKIFGTFSRGAFLVYFLS